MIEQLPEMDMPNWLNALSAKEILEGRFPLM
jgi:hypothetical protein